MRTNKIKSVIYHNRKMFQVLDVFWGFSGFYRKFVPHYATITAPITELLKKDQIFEWTEEHDQALSRLKEAIAKDITLALPDFTKDFIIYSDASQTGVGGMLAQRDDVTGELRPISFC